MQSKQQCPICSGQGVMPTPRGELYQRCPLCDGLGHAQAGQEFHAYGAYAALAANAVDVDASIMIDEYPWRLLYLTAESQGAFSALLGDVGRNKDFSNIALHWKTLFGNAQNPFPIGIAPYTFAPRASIKVQLNDLSGAGNDVYLTFHGVYLIG